MLHRSRLLLALCCSLALIVAALPASQVSVAQEPMIGPVTGVSVTAGGSWQSDAAASSSENGIDSLVFTNESAQFVVTTGTADISTSFLMLGITHPVTDIDVASTYALRGIDAEGTPFGLFQVATGNGVQTLVAPVSTFGSHLSDAQVNIQVDGAAVMTGVDGNALAGTIAGVMGSGDSAADASVPALLGAGPTADDASTETETAATDEVDSSESAAGQEEATIEDSTEEAATETDAGVSAPPSGETGFVDANTWVSPQFGNTVTWTDDWSPRTDENGEPTFRSVVEDPNPGALRVLPYDEVCLTTTGESYVCVYVREIGDGEPAFYGPEPTVDETNSLGLPFFAIVTTDTSGSRGSYGLNGTTFLQNDRREGTMLIREHTSLPLDNLPDVIVEAQAGIEIDGVPAFSLQDEEKLRPETEEVLNSIPVLQAERDRILAEMGLVDEHHYISAAMGCDVTWSPEHRLEDGSIKPVAQTGDFDFVANVEMNPEYFYLYPSDESPVELKVTCYDSLTAPESIWAFGQPDTTVVEGQRVLYQFFADEIPSEADSHFKFAILLKPGSGVTAQIEVYTTRESLAEMEPGMLMVNGVDVAEAIAEDNFIDSLP